MPHPRAHKTKWTVLYLKTGGALRFESEESARCFALEVGDGTPVSLLPPIYA